jgi:hypothetical protein
VDAVISSPWFLVVWGALVLPSLAWTIRDLRTRNRHLMPLMQVVWALTVVYSGPIGLWLYRATGRKEIEDDNVLRRGARSVAHCYSGCGMGEIAGLFIAVGLLSLDTMWVAALTFSLAFVAGIALTVGPMVQEGTPFRVALRDAFIAETPSIAVMEIVAIGVDIWLSGGAGIGEARFWSSLVISLSCGLAAAYPVNVLLIRLGVKEGMMDPRRTDHAHA